jgi:hypothetical protein
MRMETTGCKELIRWVLSWIPDVKVLAPKNLQDRMVGTGLSPIRECRTKLGYLKRVSRGIYAKA